VGEAGASGVDVGIDVGLEVGLVVGVGVVVVHAVSNKIKISCNGFFIMRLYSFK